MSVTCRRHLPASCEWGEIHSAWMFVSSNAAKRAIVRRGWTLHRATMKAVKDRRTVGGVCQYVPNCPLMNEGYAVPLREGFVVGISFWSEAAGLKACSGLPLHAAFMAVVGNYVNSR